MDSLAYQTSENKQKKEQTTKVVICGKSVKEFLEEK